MSQDIKELLRDYANDSGYSHNDYADSMRAAAAHIEALERQLADLRQAERQAPGWQPIETAPKGAKGYSWMLLAWGPEEDKCTGFGMRWGDRFFAAPSFYCLNNERSFAFREIEVSPSHWMPSPAAPSAGQAKPDDDRREG